jgi:hypothetical protein
MSRNIRAGRNRGFAMYVSGSAWPDLARSRREAAPIFYFFRNLDLRSAVVWFRRLEFRMLRGQKFFFLRLPSFSCRCTPWAAPAHWTQPRTESSMKISEFFAVTGRPATERCRLDRRTFELAPPEMAHETKAAMIMMHVRTQQACHQLRQMPCFTDTQHQMVMVPHQAPVMQGELEPLLDPRDSLDERSPIFVIMKDRLPILPATEDVIAEPLGLLHSPSQMRHVPSIFGSNRRPLHDRSRTGRCLHLCR